jgi:hypothetical protein
MSLLCLLVLFKMVNAQDALEFDLDNNVFFLLNSFFAHLTRSVVFLLYHCHSSFLHSLAIVCLYLKSQELRSSRVVSCYATIGNCYFQPLLSQIINHLIYIPPLGLMFTLITFHDFFLLDQSSF